MHEVSEFVKRNQCFIESKKAKSIGKKGLEEKTKELMHDFFNDICKSVLNAEDDVFLIQWAIVKLDEGERNAVIEGQEQKSH